MLQWNLNDKNKNKWINGLKKIKRITLINVQLNIYIYIYIYRNDNRRKYDSLTTFMDPSVVSFRIDRTRYYGGDLEGTSIIKIFQNANNMFQAF